MALHLRTERLDDLHEIGTLEMVDRGGDRAPTRSRVLGELGDRAVVIAGLVVAQPAQPDEKPRGGPAQVVLACDVEHLEPVQPKLRRLLEARRTVVDRATVASTFFAVRRCGVGVGPGSAGAASCRRSGTHEASPP